MNSTHVLHAAIPLQMQEALASWRLARALHSLQSVPFALVGVLLFLVVGVGLGRKTPEKGRLPPHVSSWIPWLGSGVHLATNPDKFFDDAIRKHGPVFSLNAVGKKMIYVTSPALIAHVYSNPKTFDFPLIRRHMQMHIFGQSKEADHHMDEELFPAHTRQLQPGTIGNLVLKFSQHLHTNIQKLSEEIGDRGETVTDSSRLNHTMSLSTLAAMMGTTFPANEFLSAFAKFDKEFTKLAGELPGWMCKDAIVHRNECLDILEKWYLEWNERSEAGDLTEDEQVSSVIQAVLDFARKHETKTRDIAAFLLCDIMVDRQFAEHPDKVQRLRQEIQAGLEKSEEGTIDALIQSREIMNGPTFDFLTSAIKETLRVVTSVASIRRVVEDTILKSDKPNEAEGVVLKKGEMIYCLTRPTHTDPALHPHPEEWVPERFTSEYRAESQDFKTVKNDWMPFGGGTSMCEGRHIALQELRIFLVAFFHHFDARPVSSQPTRLDFSRGSGAGVMPVKGGWAIHVTRRILDGTLS